MEQRIGLIAILIMLISCNAGTKNTVSPKLAIEGTWELISGITIENNDTTFTNYTSGQKMIKIINDTHFAFLRHDLNKGADSSAIFDSGGGRYTLTGDQYTEQLDYCNYREWEGHSFQFTVSVKNDTLIQSGREKVENAAVDRIITEKYFRLK